MVRLKDWNGATRSHRPQNAVALAWSANAAMDDRIEEYSTPGAATRWRLRFGAVPCEQLRARLLACAKIRGVLGIRRRLGATGRHLKATDYVGQASRRYRLHPTPNAKRGTLYVPVLSDQRPLFGAL